MYTDPSGEFAWIIPIIGAMVGAFINAATHADQIGSSNGKAFMYMGIGALAGFASAGAGMGIGAALGAGTSMGFAAGFGASFGAGFAGGFAGGFINGAGNTWIQGGSFEQGLFGGLQTGFISGGISGVTAGIAGGIKGIKIKGVFDRGCEQLGVNPWDPIPENLRTDEFATDAKDAWYKNGPDAFHKVDHSDIHTKGNFGAIEAHPSGLSGKPTIYYNYNKAFNSPLQLFTTMGHELVHVSQYAALAAAGYSNGVLQKPGFIDMLDYYANIYTNSIGGIWREPIKGNWYYNYSRFFKTVDYVNFPWTKIKPTFIYPF